MMKKTLPVLILVFLVGLIFVNAEKVDIGQEVIDYVLDNFQNTEILETSILFYYNPNVCLDCEESLEIINNLKSKGYSIFVTTKYFTDFSAGSLAVCLKDYSAKTNTKPGEIKSYADYCKNFTFPPRGYSALPKREDRYRKYIQMEEDAVKEDVIYITPIKGHYPGFGAYLDFTNAKIKAMSEEEQAKLIEKAEKFVIDRTWESFYKNIRELEIEDNKLYEEGSSLTPPSTPEATARLAEIDERRTEIKESMQTLRSLYEKAYDAGDMDLLKDYSLPWEGEVIDSFVLRKGWAPILGAFLPDPVKKLYGIGSPDVGIGSYDEQDIVMRLRETYIFVEEKFPKVKQEEITIEEEPKIIEEKPTVEEKPVTEEPVVEEQPVTGINRIINPIRKLFTGEPEKAEEIPSEQPAEQSEEKKENFVIRFFKKIFSWF